jgi:hypothetical protein
LCWCEILEMGNNSAIERVHIKFCKVLLNIKKCILCYMENVEKSDPVN